MWCLSNTTESKTSFYFEQNKSALCELHSNASATPFAHALSLSEFGYYHFLSIPLPLLLSFPNVSSSNKTINNTIRKQHFPRNSRNAELSEVMQSLTMESLVTEHLGSHLCTKIKKTKLQWTTLLPRGSGLIISTISKGKNSSLLVTSQNKKPQCFWSVGNKFESEVNLYWSTSHLT